MQQILHNRNALGEVLEIFLIDDGFLEFKVDGATVTIVSVDLLKRVLEKARDFMEKESDNKHRRHM